MQELGKLNLKISVIPSGLERYTSITINKKLSPIMQELGKFNLKVSVISSGLERYISITISSKLSFIDSFQFLSSSLDSLIKNLNQDDFKYLSQKFDKNILDLVNQNEFYSYE